MNCSRHPSTPFEPAQGNPDLPKPLDPLRFPLWGSRLIEASAGTGKTFTIATLYVRLVLGHRGPEHGPMGRRLPEQALIEQNPPEHELPQQVWTGTETGAETGAEGRVHFDPPEILVVTFTDAATQELRERIRLRLTEAARYFRADPLTLAPRPPGEDPLHDLRADYASYRWPGCAQRLELAAQWMDEAAVSTIHAWCNRMLREHAFDSDSLFTQRLETDQSELIAEVVRDYWRSFMLPLGLNDADEVRQWWSEPASLETGLSRLLEHAGLLDEAPPPARSLAEVRAKREARLAELKAPWPLWVEELQVLLDQAVARKACDGRKLRPGYYHPWLQALRDWAGTPAAEVPNLGKGWERLTPAGLAEAWKQGEPPPHPALAAMSELRLALADLPQARDAIHRHAAHWVAERLATEQGRRSQMGFDDLLTRLARALEGPNGQRLAGIIRAQFPVALIDEFQDTDPVQYRIFDAVYRVAANHPATALVLIGDPKQAIYAFRGADIYTYLQARRACAGRLYTLQRNFRSTHEMVAAVNRCFLTAEERVPGQGAFLFRTAVENPVPFLPALARGREEVLVAAGQPLPALTAWWLMPREEGKTLGKIAYREEIAAVCASEMTRLLNLGQAGQAGFAPLAPPVGQWTGTGANRPSGPGAGGLMSCRFEAGAGGVASCRFGEGASDSDQAEAGAVAGGGFHTESGAGKDAACRPKAETGEVMAFRPLRPADLAVLVNNRTEAAAIRQALARRGVRSVYLSDQESVFQTFAASELRHWLAACAEPEDPRLLRAALATATLGRDWTELEEMNQDELAWEGRVLQFGGYRDLWRRQGVLPMLRRLLHDFEVPARLLAQGATPGEGERTLTDLLHLAELLQAASGLIEGEYGLIRYLAEQCADQRSGSQDDARQIRLESDADLVQVVTIHKAKGLEYPLVFLPFAADHRPTKGDDLPLKWHDDQGRLQISLDAEAEILERAEIERLGEDLRKLYVALTRARYATWVGLAPLDQMERGAFGYLLSGGEPLPAADLASALQTLGEEDADPTSPAPLWGAGSVRCDQSDAVTPTSPPPSRGRGWGRGGQSVAATIAPLLAPAPTTEVYRPRGVAQPSSPPPAQGIGPVSGDQSIAATPTSPPPSRGRGWGRGGQSVATTTLGPARESRPVVREPWWIASYSALRTQPAETVAAQDKTAATPLEERLQEMALAGTAPEPATRPNAPLLTSLPPGGAGTGGEGVILSPLPPRGGGAGGEGVSQSPQLPFSPHAFPRGAEAGTFLHDLLEWAAQQGFASLLAEPRRLRDAVARRCQPRGWEVWIDPLTAWLRQLLSEPLPLPGDEAQSLDPDRHSAPHPARLFPPSPLVGEGSGERGSISRGHRPDGHPAESPSGLQCRLADLETFIPEMEFWLTARRVNVQVLDRLVCTGTLGGAPRPALQPNQLNGMLKGFMDLVFAHQGRYYVLDYKSNWLGPDASAYTHPAMAAAILHERYELQYVLYLFALHRLLKARLPDYDYDRHLGGAVYLFLRGIAAPSRGVHAERPPRSLIEALDGLFAGVNAEVKP